MRIYIYGAKSIAIGVCRALQMLYPSHKVEGFLVTSLEGNPSVLLGLPVLAIDEFAFRFPEGEKPGIHILIATPENIHKAIVTTLEEHGFLKYTCVNSRIEAELMERFFACVTGAKKAFDWSFTGFIGGNVTSSVEGEEVFKEGIV